MNPIDLREVWIKSENEFQGDYVYLLKSFHEFIYKKMILVRMNELISS